MLGLSPSVANREHLGKASNGLAKGNTLSSRQHRGVSGYTTLPVAEAPEELKQLVRTNHTHMDAGMDFLTTKCPRHIASSSKVPKPIYFLTFD